MPIDVTSEQFDALVSKAIEALPPEFRSALDVVRVEVRDRPTPEQLASVGLSEDQLLLGLYVGVPLTERSVADSSRLPDVIYLFREDLEDACDSTTLLRDEVRTTLYHELGHYFGFDESGLDQLGYG
jgi:predicted Zn-dependent protease with MMP-like domain